MEDKQEENLEQVKRSYQSFNSKASAIEKEGEGLIKDLEEVLNKIESQRLLHKIKNKYDQDNN